MSKLAPRLLALVWAAGVLSPASLPAAAWEKYVLFLPLRASDARTQAQSGWLGWACRDVFIQSCQVLGTVVALREDELAALSREYRLTGGEPEPGLLERIADEKELAIVDGTFAWVKSGSGRKLMIRLRIVPGRNEEPRIVALEGDEAAVRAWIGKFVKETFAALDVTPRESAKPDLARLPGTDSFAAWQNFSQAWTLLRPDPQNAEACAKALPFLTKALKADPNYASALALSVLCRLAPGAPAPAVLAQLQKDADRAAAADPGSPWAQNARLEVLLARGQAAEAEARGREAVAAYPLNYRSHLLLGRALRDLKRIDDAERVLLTGLDQQGTALQKKPFNLELGLLLLKAKDEKAEIYLREVLRLEPNRADLHFQRGSALYRLGRYLDAMDEVQRAEALKSWPALTVLKAMTALALGNAFLNEQDFDRAYTFTIIAHKLRPAHFETALLLAKVMRKKGLAAEARQALETARGLAEPKRPKDHLFLGTEFVAQGYKSEGAQEYVAYLRAEPKAPERESLIAAIRKLRGEPEGEE